MVLMFIVTGSQVLSSTCLMADELQTGMVAGGAYTQTIADWRAQRFEGLSKTDGWLTLIALKWLKEGENRVGSGAENDIRLTGGPDIWGSVILDEDQLRFVNADTANVSINQKPLAQATMVADTEGEPTIISSGRFSFYVIYRESYALRVKDAQAPALLNFKGVDNFPINESWRVNGHFTQAPPNETIEIVNVLGQVSPTPVAGSFEFEMNGRKYSLLALQAEGDERVWFIFADRTSGHGTYGAGRFLYSEGMPENNRLTVDFNKSYNPPCAFNPYSTCPLPPQRNRLDLAVTAGEKDFHPDSG